VDSTVLIRHASFICPKPKSAVYGNENFITTGSFAFTSSCVLQLALAEVCH